MSFEDRQGTHLNRKKLKIISQTPTEIVADIERADENITVTGTAINAQTFIDFETKINNALTSADDALKKAENALKDASSAASNATEAKSKVDEFENSNAILNTNYSLETADWASTDVNTLTVSFGTNSNVGNNIVKFCDQTGVTHIVIDGDVYVQNGQKKVSTATFTLEGTTLKIIN